MRTSLPEIPLPQLRDVPKSKRDQLWADLADDVALSTDWICAGWSNGGFCTIRLARTGFALTYRAYRDSYLGLYDERGVTLAAFIADIAVPAGHDAAKVSIGDLASHTPDIDYSEYGAVARFRLPHIVAWLTWQTLVRVGWRGNPNYAVTLSSDAAFSLLRAYLPKAPFVIAD